jgi:hypothetical protein
MPGALLPIGIGAAAGLAGSIFGPKEQTTSTSGTQTTTLDPQTQAALDQYRKAAFGQYQASQRGAPDWSKFLATMMPRAMQQGTTGIESFFDPYQSQVIGGVQTDFDRQRALAMTQAAGTATQQGAFGGNRAAILQGMGQRDINQNEMSMLAGLRSGGWQNALQALLGQRQQAAGLMGQGMSGMNDATMRQLAALQAMMGGLNFGGSTTTSTGQQVQPLNRNPIAGMLGGALSGYSMFGGGGGGGGNMAAPGGAWLPDYMPGGPAGGYFPQYR